MQDIFRTVNELIDSRDCVLSGNAVQSDGQLYVDSLLNLHALRMLEPSLRGLVATAVNTGRIDTVALGEIIELIGEPAL